MLGVVLLKVQFGSVQNELETVRSGYALACLFNGSIQLQVTIHVNINQPGTIYKWAA